MEIHNSTSKSSSESESDDALVSHDNNQITEVPFLPEDIIFKILLLLPAKVLLGVMTIVCKSWCNLIHDPVFIKLHRSTTSPVCLLIYDSFFRIYSLKNGGITWKYKNTINHDYVTHGDGFILTIMKFCDSSFAYNSSYASHSILYLVNPLTEQIIPLPRLPKSSLGADAKCTVSCSPSTFKYKVVIMKSPRLYILTVGDDKEWREIGMSPETSSRRDTTTIIGHRGLTYWRTGNYINAFDVENEVFYKVTIPKEVPASMPKLCSGSRLVMYYGRPTIDCKEFWELVDYRNGGEWRKFGIVDFESKKQEIIEILGLQNSPDVSVYHMKPVVVLSTDVVIFEFDRCFLAYNFKTEQFSRSFDCFRQFSKRELMIDNSLYLL